MLDKVRIQWIQWMAQYYFYPIGQVLALCLPPKQPKNIVDEKSSCLPSSFSLTTDQMRCVKHIQKNSQFKVHVLYGVTGSGKTEVYLKLIHDVIKKNKTALVLVPEISLTSQLFSRFSLKFPNQVALLHSGLTSKQKFSEWQGILTGKKKVLLGARSALFCPLPRLSIIIVDEEHEAHFKQEEKLKYHARDVSIMLAKMYNIPVVLGSATPSLETWFHIQKGKYQCHQLPQRFQNRPMPQIQVIDLKKENKRRKKLKNKNLPFWLSESLFLVIQETLDKKKQVALFLNRRGQSTLSLCVKCGKPQTCIHCDVSLTRHSDRYLVCHYCHYSIGVDVSSCEVCKSQEVWHVGVGTEGVFSENSTAISSSKSKGC